MTADKYVHGYSGRENERLFDQANTLADLLHHDTIFEAGSHVLEAGCGTGAQTAILARNNPMSLITSIDISPASIEEARATMTREGISNVTLQLGNILELPFEENSFDHIFVCFVLEHLEHPLEALKHLMAVLKPGGTITAIEGDHESTFFYPNSLFAKRTIHCLVEIQRRAGGNALIGRELYPLLKRAGLQNVRVTPRHVYVDSSKPNWVEGFTKNTFAAMVEGVKEQALKEGLIAPHDWERGISDLYATAEGNGTFNYTFFKGTGIKQ